VIGGFSVGIMYCSFSEMPIIRRLIKYTTMLVVLESNRNHVS
jgi:hypothetical protein